MMPGAFQRGFGGARDREERATTNRINFPYQKGGRTESTLPSKKKKSLLPRPTISTTFPQQTTTEQEPTTTTPTVTETTTSSERKSGETWQQWIDRTYQEAIDSGTRDPVEENLLRELIGVARNSDLRKELLAKLRTHKEKKALTELAMQESAVERERLRKEMASSLQFMGAGQEAAMLRSSQLGASRAGLAFSGIGQAAQENVRGQFALARVQSMAEFENNLSVLAVQEAQRFRAGEFDFFRTISAMGLQHNYDMAIAEFQMRMQQDIEKSKAWGNVFGSIFNAIGTIGGAIIGSAGGPVGTIAGASIGSNVMGEATGSGLA
jgi:hypothetical protein